MSFPSGTVLLPVLGPCEVPLLSHPGSTQAGVVGPSEGCQSALYLIVGFPSFTSSEATGMGEL